MIGEVTVGDGDPRGSLDGVDETIAASRHGHVVDPDILRPEDRYSVGVALSPEAEMVDGVSDHPAALAHNVVDPQPVDDHVPHELYGYPGAVGNVDVGATRVDGLVSLHDEFLAELDDHAALEYDPQRPLLDDGVAEGSGPRVQHVVVGWVGDQVRAAGFPAGGSPAEAEDAVGESAAVLGPERLATPAAVDWVGGLAWPTVALR